MTRRTSCLSLWSWRASAAATSASPPVLAKGTTSDDSRHTRRGCMRARDGSRRARSPGESLACCNDPAARVPFAAMPRVVFVAPFAADTTLRFARAAAELPEVDLALVTQEAPEKLPDELRRRLK